MAVCQNCNRQWSYKQIFRRSFKKEKKCPYCGYTNFISSKSAQRISWFGLIIPLIWIAFPLFEVPYIYSLILSITIIVLNILLMPFMTELCKREVSPK
ncbi:TIGR04104 family putative zinc finger protein [Scopulibacillus darangshiensis]|uniref:TIGR04104 family putative zinc finger protein n=1 Tax=Scopulibacillus darangshiensis TaxID=442528 RepID=UPI00140444B2